MSGHSKWAKVKHKKGVADLKKSATFTKLANAITVAAKQGGGEPDTNFKLQLAIDKAKSANMPKDNIERAIKRGTGELAGQAIEEAVYEGYGPAGIAIIIEALTDNKKRTVSDIRHVLTRFGGNLGGNVLWMFEKKGAIRIAKDKLNIKSPEDLDNFILKAIDWGAEDVKEETGELEGEVAIYTKTQDLQKMKQALEKEGVEVTYAEVEYIPKDVIKVADEGTKDKLKQIYEELDNLEDVNNFYTNAEF